MEQNAFMAREFSRFALQMQESLAPGALSGEESILLEQLFSALYAELDNAQVCLDLQAWLSAQNKPMTISELRGLLSRCAVIGSINKKDTLFVLDERNRLYMQRYFSYENIIAERVKQMLCRTQERLNQAQQNYLKQLDIHDWHKAMAISVAMHEALTVISGGPGTGKTWTVLRILQGLLIKNPQLRIALAAPTGKAAARMIESIRNGINQVSSDSIRERIPVQAQTIHRLLNQSYPLPFDVVVIDEAGMVSLSLMARLMQTLKPSCRLILLGDKNQLASVEEGAVFAELSERFEFDESARRRYEKEGFDVQVLTPRNVVSGSVDMTNHTVWLTQSHRYDPNGAIACLAEHIRLGHAREGWNSLLHSKDTSAELIELAESEQSLSRYLPEICKRFMPYVQAVRAYQEQPNEQLKPLFDALKEQVVLCCTNEGAFGVEAINREVRFQWFGNEQIAYSDHFEGEVVMVTVNDNELGLANGDVGIVLAKDNTHVVYFESLNEMGTVTYRSVPLGRLPASKRAFAMTIHKSQGSEFSDVLVILPPFSRVLTRELIYTAVTRAKTKVRVLAQAQTFKNAVLNKTERLSGLLYR